MSYDYENIINSTHLVPFSKNYKIGNFKCKYDEYNDFLVDQAEDFENGNVSSTQLLIDNLTGDVIGYFSLCMASIKLTDSEKNDCNMDNVPFNSIPVLKIGKLAIDEGYSSKQKGYGSYLIQLVRGMAYEINEISKVACRFIVVDADIEHDKNTPCFYEKNGFVLNESVKGNRRTVSMRLDIFKGLSKEIEKEVIA